MRKIKIAPGEYYHIYNRGNNEQKIFLDNRDRIRFLFLILYFQAPLVFHHISRRVSYFVQHRVFDISKKVTEEIIEKRYVKLVGFVLMPNHFHLIVYVVRENGISQYMQRVLDAYTKYFNTKHERSGHLLQGPFQIVHIKDNKQLLYLSAYIHLNPREIKGWKNKEHLFPWSTYQDFIEENRWGKLLDSRIIMGQFSNGEEYKDFVRSSGAKKLPGEENFRLD